MSSDARSFYWQNPTGGKSLDNVVDIVTQLVTPIIDAHQFELVDIEFVNEDKSWYLRLYIDKPGGITIDECALVSDELSEKLDELDPDPIPQAYFFGGFFPGCGAAVKKTNETTSVRLDNTFTYRFTKSLAVRKYTKAH